MSKKYLWSVILSFIGLMIETLAFLRVWYIGKFFDDIFFTFPFGIAKYYIYGITAFIFIGIIIQKTQLFKKKTFIISIPIFVIGLTGLFAAISSHTVGIEGFKKSITSYVNNGWVKYSNNFDGEYWFDFNEMRGGFIGALLNGIVGYITTIGAFIVFSMVILIGFSLVVYGSYWTIHKKIYEKRDVAKSFFKKLKLSNIKAKLRKVGHIEGEEGIIPLDEEDNVTISHSTLDTHSSNPFIELEKEDMEVLKQTPEHNKENKNDINIETPSFEEPEDEPQMDDAFETEKDIEKSIETEESFWNNDQEDQILNNSTPTTTTEIEQKLNTDVRPYGKVDDK